MGISLPKPARAKNLKKSMTNSNTTNSSVFNTADDLKADPKLLDPFRERLNALLHQETNPKEYQKYDATEVNTLADSDDDMGRFLVARHNDLDKAVAMASAALQWRSKFKPSQLTPADFPTGHSQAVWRFAGTTKNGWGILHITAKNWSSWAYSVDEYIKMVAYHMEQNLARNGNQKNFLILDMTSMGYLTDMRKLRQLAKVLNDYYPERLGAGIFVNCDWVFDKLFNICIKWVDKRTQEKLIDFRSNGAEFLREHVDADQLTKDLGGTREEQWPMEEVPTESH